MSATAEPTCRELYGPYPRAIPVTYINKDEDTPSKDVIDEAKTIYDVPVDHRDVGTPDAWLPSDGRLIRLTGKHPFNAEPPASVHQKYKFITPTSLHYVRNHGASPRLKWEDHKICVGGSLVSTKLELSMDEISEMESREIPVTLACAGNRRKEQNMIRQTIGSDNGASSVSTNVWKGTPLRDILLRAGVSEKKMRGKHVEFIGVEDLPNKVGPGPFADAPWGKLVKNGTSIPLARAMNPAYDIMIAYEANGEKLLPDQGYPVRVIIPGFIGGKMIKWLKEINVIDHESKNHFHYHDNRILPPHVTAQESLKGDWWYKPEYIFNELNINSAVTKPDHNEEIPIAKNIDKTYDISGYAYTGGGKKITRVEVSLDEGVNWEVSEIDYKERATDHGMYWCWVSWKYSIKVADLIGCKEVWCRAWDESNNCQPDNPTWNLMGMGNNQAFRMKVHMDKNAKGDHIFQFEHPTQAGSTPGGWMTKAVEKPESAGFGKLLEVEEEVQDEPESPSEAKTTQNSGDGKKLFTMEEINKHNTEEDCWIVIRDKVYDATEYLELHPGGIDSIIINAGEDSTEDFDAIHSNKARKMLDKYLIGDVDKSSAAAVKGDPDELVDEDGNKLALNPKKKTPFRLRNKTVLSRDSFLLDFELPTPEHVLGLPTGKHIFLTAKINGELVMRRYTPISSNYDVGCVKFVIKAYPPMPPRFPIGGKMSQYLDALKIGDMLDMRGPIGEFEYTSKGSFLLEGENSYATKFNMIAGGTGITPVMQIASEVLRNPDDPTQMSLIFACREEGDLLMRSTLDEWAANFPNKFKVHYILSDKWPKDWKYSTGFVDKKLFDEELYPAGKDVYNLMCGPPIMLDRGCTPNLVALGHERHNVFSF